MMTARSGQGCVETLLSINNRGGDLKDIKTKKQNKNKTVIAHNSPHGGIDYFHFN